MIVNDHIGTHFTATDEKITRTGTTEHYPHTSRKTAVERCLYTHRLHNGKAFSTRLGVVHCPSCGQIAITNIPVN